MATRAAATGVVGQAQAQATRAASGGRVPHVVVFGASGYVGSAICQEALRRMWRVTGVSRHGDQVWREAPTAASAPSATSRWFERVQWVRGDVLRPTTTTAAANANNASWITYLRDNADDIDAVVCSIGGFGSVAWMERINGEANINVFRAVHELGDRAPTRVGFVSAHQYHIPHALQAGYFHGKRNAEAVLREYFPPTTSSATTATERSTGNGDANAASRRLPPAAVITMPSFVYGERYVPQWKRSLPLHYIGTPMNALFRRGPFTTLSSLPALDLVLTPPVSVQTVAASLLSRLLDPLLPPGTHAVTVQDMLRDEEATARRT